ncbi:MAG: hypothetical protein ABIF87_07140 [Pseudomonadota bacterium]
MTAKKDAKKRRRAKRKKNKLKMKSGRALLLDKVKKSDHLAGRKVIIEPQGAEKMSEVLQDFAAPLLNECDDDESVKKALAVAIIVWNLSLLPEKDRAEAIENLSSELAPSDNAADTALTTHYIEMMMERRQKLFPDNKRTIMNYQFSGSGKNLRLDVASTLSL